MRAYTRAPASDWSPLAGDGGGVTGAAVIPLSQCSEGSRDKGKRMDTQRAVKDRETLHSLGGGASD